MKKTLRHSVVLVAALLGAVVSAAPAGAGSAPVETKPAEVGVMAKNDCFENRLCFWRDADYKGPLGMYPMYPAGHCYSMGAMNNEVTSVWNRTGRTVYLFNSSNCTGSVLIPGSGLQFPSYREEANLETYLLNDKVSSFMWP